MYPKTQPTRWVPIVQKQGSKDIPLTNLNRFGIWRKISYSAPKKFKDVFLSEYVPKFTTQPSKYPRFRHFYQSNFCINGAFQWKIFVDNTPHNRSWEKG